MDKRPERERVAEPEKAALILARGAQVQRLHARLAAREGKPHEPRKDAHHSRVPPSQTPKANRPTRPGTGTRREARVGRAGGGRPLHPDPDQVLIARAKSCPHGGGAVQAHAQHGQAVYDTLALPPITPIVTRVEPPGGPCPPGGQSYVAPGPVGREPGPPLGASLEGLAPDRRYTPALRYERLSALVAQV